MEQGLILPRPSDQVPMSVDPRRCVAPCSEPDNLESDNRRKQFLGFLTNVDIFIIAVHYSLLLFSLSNNPIIILYHFSLRTLLRMRTRVRNSVRLKHQSFLKLIIGVKINLFPFPDKIQTRPKISFRSHFTHSCDPTPAPSLYHLCSTP